MTKLNATGTALLYSTLGVGGQAIAVDSDGNAYAPSGQLRKLDPSGSNSLASISLDVGEGFITALRIDNLYVAYNSGRLGSSPNGFGSPVVTFTGGFIAKILDNLATLFVPIVLSSGGLSSSFYTTELTLTNRGPKEAKLELTYAAAFGGGSGTASDKLPAGQQRIFPDAMAYLKSRGIPTPDTGARGGTLMVRFTNLSSSSDVAVTARTTTPAPAGRAGLAYVGVATSEALSGTSYLFGLRQNALDRSNVAIQNAGGPSDGDIVLRLTVLSGDPAAPVQQTLADQKLSPGGFKQINGILHSSGLSVSNGYVRVERVSGTAPYYAYAVINDQANSDGSFVRPFSEADLGAAFWELTLPAVVETGSFTSELIITNPSPLKRTVSIDYVAQAIQTADHTANLMIELDPGEQRIIPDWVQWLRDQMVPGIGPSGPAYAGPLFAKINYDSNSQGIFLAARTSTPGGGGRYGVFYVGVGFGEYTPSQWLYGLQQGGETRTNVALVNRGGVDASPAVFRIRLYDGETGLRVATVEGITVEPKGWKQIGSILARYAPGTTQGYAHVTRTSGFNPFLAYAVINDGGQPGERTGDGTFIASSP